MLVRALERDIPAINALVRDGAQRGSFDGELATDSDESRAFYDGLREAVLHDVWSRPVHVALPGRVPVKTLMWRETAVSQPIGFVSIRGIGALGFELWLTAIETEERGRGLGRRMLAEFLASELGAITRVAQCRVDAPGGLACAHILGSLGFTAARVGRESVWMARSDLPADVLHWIHDAPFVAANT